MPISGGDNGGDTTSVMVPEEAYVLSVVGYEAVVNLPTVNSTEAGNSDNNTKVKITTTIDAANKTQYFTTSAAIAMYIQDTVTTPNISKVWGEKSSTKFYVAKVDGDSVGKVEIDQGAWGEYSDNPVDVKDWEHIMLKVRKFAGRAFVLHVEVKLNHQLEKTPWTRGEEESNGKGALNDTHVNSSGVIGDMSKSAPENTSRLTLISVPMGINIEQIFSGYPKLC